MEYREFRAEVTAAEGNKLSGVLAPFGSETTIGRLERGGWREEIAPGAFSKALREGDTVLLCDHDMSKPLARVSAGTLRLREEADGLHFDADIVDTSYARDVMANVAARNKKGMSIGFEPVKDEWRDEDGKPATRRTGTRRILREVKLPEGSVVTNPAYKDTSVYARDDSTALLEERERDSDAIVGDYIVILEGRASSIDAATRRKYAAKGWALHDGSYPIPDEDHLHAAAVLVASGHGDVEAAKALIRRRAKELGVDVTTLPGFGKESKDEGEEPEARDLPGDQEPDASTPESEDPDKALRDAEIRRIESRRDLDF